MPDITPSSSPPDSSQPARVLGCCDASCVVIGAIIGVGIFFNPTGVAKLAGTGPLALLAWAIAGLIALWGALAFAQLGRTYHASGAQYEILRDSYGPLSGFLFVFCNATAVQGGTIAVIAIACVKYAAIAIGGELSATGVIVGAAILIVLDVLANILGTRNGSLIQNITVIGKIATLLAITILAATFSPKSGPAPVAETVSTLSPIAGITAALVPAFFAYGGWQHALWISGEVREPRKNLPRAIIGGTVLVIVVYLLANWAYLHLLGLERVKTTDALASDAVAAVFPGAGRRVIAGAVAVSALGVLNAQLLSGPRLVYAMARDGRFFSAFGHLHPNTGTPARAILMMGGVALLLLILSAAGKADKIIDTLVNGTVFIDSVFLMLTGTAVLIFRRRAKRADRGGLYYPIVAALFALGMIGVLTGSLLDSDTRLAVLVGVAWIAGAAVLYGVRFRRA